MGQHTLTRAHTHTRARTHTHTMWLAKIVFKTQRSRWKRGKSDTKNENRSAEILLSKFSFLFISPVFNSFYSKGRAAKVTGINL